MLRHLFNLLLNKPILLALCCLPSSRPHTTSCKWWPHTTSRPHTKPYKRFSNCCFYCEFPCPMTSNDKMQIHNRWHVTLSLRRKATRWLGGCTCGVQSWPLGYGFNSSLRLCLVLKIVQSGSWSSSLSRSLINALRLAAVTLTRFQITMPLVNIHTCCYPWCIKINVS